MCYICCKYIFIVLLHLFSIFQHKDLKFYRIETVMLKRAFSNFIPKNIYLLTSEWPHFFHFKLKQFEIYFCVHEIILVNFFVVKQVNQ